MTCSPELFGTSSRSALSQDDHPADSPDGQAAAFVTHDLDGDRQVVTMTLAAGSVRLLTNVKRSAFGTPVWSPDGAMVAVPDEEHGLWLVATDDAFRHRVAVDPMAAIRNARSLPNGRSLTHSTTCATGAHALHLLDLGSGRDVVVTPLLESDHTPGFSADGRALFFLSARHDRPVLAVSGPAALEQRLAKSRHRLPQTVGTFRPNTVVQSIITRLQARPFKPPTSFPFLHARPTVSGNAIGNRLGRG